MLQLKAYKYRAYPTEKQKIFLSKNFGCVRFVWNKLVEDFNTWSPDHEPEPISVKTLKDDPENFFLKEVISYALQQKENDFAETKKQFFNKSRKKKLGKPRFRSRHAHRDSFRIPGQKCQNAVDFEKETIKLPKMSPMKITIHRPFSGDLRSVNVSRNPSGQYFVSVLVQEHVELKQSTGRSVGIDLGLNHLLILSNGIKIENPRWFRENQAKLKRAQQHLSRKVKGSRRREKQRLKVARIHQKTANQRKWYQHDVSTWLVNNFDQIFTEDLNVAGMVKCRSRAKSISDAGWSGLVSMIEYKSNWYGRTFHQIDRWFPSSKTCSCCGYKFQELGGKEEWICPVCDSEHDRDINAAVNILHKGRRDLYGLTSAESADYIRGEDVRPKVQVPPAWRQPL